jgi:hypothetical protein
MNWIPQPSSFVIYIMARTRTVTSDTRRPRRMTSIVKMGARNVVRMIGNLAVHFGRYLLENSDELESHGTKSASANTRAAVVTRETLANIAKATVTKGTRVNPAIDADTTPATPAAPRARRRRRQGVPRSPTPGLLVVIQSSDVDEDIPTPITTPVSTPVSTPTKLKINPKKGRPQRPRPLPAILDNQRGEVLRSAVYIAKRPPPEELALQAALREQSRRENQVARQADATRRLQARLDSADPAIRAAAMQEEADRQRNPPVDECRSPVRFFVNGPQGTLVERSSGPDPDAKALWDQILFKEPSEDQLMCWDV